ncbi:ATP-binding protein [Allosphingosinicella sp.]|jgi:PAS domain-containing protein|uniref:PAS domain-containing sensor histidine kinase n=1 Tax=Allosphingosinicella sp. TaxID=2823234 RepID=UPI002EF97F99
MTVTAAELRPAAGRLDSEGRLIAADPPLLALHRRAGGKEGGALAVPQIASLARLARRLGIVISRAAIAADGERDLDLWVRAEPDSEGIALTVTGWTDRPAQSAAEAPEEERESDFLRASADWTWETDETLRLTSLSSGAAAAIGRPPAEMVGKQLTRLFRFRESGDGSLPILNALAEQSRFDGQVAELRSGTKARYALSGVPLIDGMGRFSGFRGSASSIRNLPASAPASDPEGFEPPAFGQRLDKALRLPLDQIIASAETISAQEGGPLRHDYASYACDIAAAARHLLALVDDLVDLQAIERPDFRPELEPLDLADVARRAAGLLSVRAADRHVRIDRPAEDESLPATGEFKRALQILMNLIANAIRYSPEGGMVWIRSEEEGDLAAIIVADQGKGIAPEDHERIFEKFERVDPHEPGGTGLGLYIARRLARSMGGDIAVDSAPGQGARFTFTLPRRPR